MITEQSLVERARLTDEEFRRLHLSLKKPNPRCEAQATAKAQLAKALYAVVDWLGSSDWTPKLRKELGWAQRRLLKELEAAGLTRFDHPA